MGERVEWVVEHKNETADTLWMGGVLFGICRLSLNYRMSHLIWLRKRQIRWYFSKIIFWIGHLSDLSRLQFTPHSRFDTEKMENDYCWSADKTIYDFVEFRWQATSSHNTHTHPNWSNTHFGFIKHWTRCAYIRSRVRRV